jgi:hypothetical protein
MTGCIGEDIGVIRSWFGGWVVVVLGLWVATVPSGPERMSSMSWSPFLIRSVAPDDRLLIRLGHEAVDAYLEFLAARCRPNTVIAAGSDLKIFFTLVPKDPDEATTADVLGFITTQRSVGDPKVVRLVDGESGLWARTIKRRLSSLSSMFGFLARGDVDSNPVPQGLPTRRSRRRGSRGVPLVRTPRTLPQIVAPEEVDALLGACRRIRDRAMCQAPRDLLTLRSRQTQQAPLRTRSWTSPTCRHQLSSHRRW